MKKLTKAQIQEFSNNFDVRLSFKQFQELEATGVVTMTQREYSKIAEDYLVSKTADLIDNLPEVSNVDFTEEDFLELDRNIRHIAKMNAVKFKAQHNAVKDVRMQAKRNTVFYKKYKKDNII